MDHIGIEVGFEGLEVGPRPSPEELVLDVAEDLLRGAVVDAVALPGHALHYLRLPQVTRPRLVLALPAHVAVQDRGSRLRASSLGTGRAGPSVGPCLGSSTCST